MLAVVVVKVHDDLDLSKCKANVEIIGDGKCIHRGHRKIRKLPEQKEVKFYQGEISTEVPVNFMKKICQHGYNICIGEILGEYDDIMQTTEED